MLTNHQLRRVQDSIDLTRERFEREGFDGDDESMDMLEEFCKILLSASDENVDRFLTGQDMELPPGGDE